MSGLPNRPRRGTLAGRSSATARRLSSSKARRGPNPPRRRADSMTARPGRRTQVIDMALIPQADPADASPAVARLLTEVPGLANILKYMAHADNCVLPSIALGL